MHQSRFSILFIVVFAVGDDVVKVVVGSADELLQDGEEGERNKFNLRLQCLGTVAV